MTRRLLRLEASGRAGLARARVDEARRWSAVRSRAADVGWGLGVVGLSLFACGVVGSCFTDTRTIEVRSHALVAVGRVVPFDDEPAVHDAVAWAMAGGRVCLQPDRLERVIGRRLRRTGAQGPPPQLLALLRAVEAGTGGGRWLR